MQGESALSDDRDVPLERRELYSELVLERCRSCFAFRPNIGEMGEAAPSLTGGSMIDSTLPFSLSATRPGLDFALGNNSSENRTLLDRRFDAGLSLLLEAASPISDTSEEMDDRKMGRTFYH